MATRLIKGDPDSATSPSKYNTTTTTTTSAVDEAAAAAAAGDSGGSSSSNLPDVAKIAALSVAEQNEAEKILGISKDPDDNVFESGPNQHPTAAGASSSPKKKGRKQSSIGTEALSEVYRSKEGKKEMTYFTKSENTSEFQIERAAETFAHKSKSGFNLEDVKAALTNAKVIGESDKCIELAKQSPLKEAQMKRVASKWKALAEKIAAHNGRTGITVLDERLRRDSERGGPNSPRRKKTFDFDEASIAQTAVTAKDAAQGIKKRIAQFVRQHFSAKMMNQRSKKNGAIVAIQKEANDVWKEPS